MTRSETKANKVAVEAQHQKKVLWGKQTEMALKHFDIGSHFFAPAFMAVLVAIKRAGAASNHADGLLTEQQCSAILFACDQLTNDQIDSDFAFDHPLNRSYTDSRHTYFP